jgi:hypothetical protein
MGSSGSCSFIKKHNKIEIDSNLNTLNLTNITFNDPCIIIYKKINEKDAYVEWYNYLYRNINKNNKSTKTRNTLTKL